MQESNQSLVARFRAAQELEEQAAQHGLYGLAIVARHDAITARMERLTHRLQALEDAGQLEEVKALLTNDALWDEEDKIKGESTATPPLLPQSLCQPQEKQKPIIAS